jgi:predicted site-specific integrase-resolvase
MRGEIKLAKVSIKYKQKRKGGKNFETIKTRKVEVIIVITYRPRTLKFKDRTISKVCRELGLNLDKLIDPVIDEIEILADLGKTNYDI